MLNAASGAWKVILTLLFFPLFFQHEFVIFALGANDSFWLALFKRLFLLLPVLSIILACWVTIPCVLSVVFRTHRPEFVITFFLIWWDLGKAILSFWGGILKFLLVIITAVLGLMRLAVVGIWVLIEVLFFIPYRLFKIVGEGIFEAGIPWIALVLTFIWCLLEATVFTYVMTPLVMDTLSSLTGESIPEALLRIPLFLFLFFLILGSYAVLSTWAEALSSKKIGTIIKIGLIELVALFVEVVFLYREFVDSLIPWFAQHTSGDFELGIVGTLAIAATAWLGIRGMSWVLFASHGTPMIMAIIQGAGVRGSSQASSPAARKQLLEIVLSGQVREEIEWALEKGNEIFQAFLIPPLQVLAASVNFCTFLFTSILVFEIPLTSLDQIMDSKGLLENAFASSRNKERA
ncbi:hypothetical protein MYX75_12625 [Acidobacteria bacterium AH-259-A15]|nr:hypothetical protein [Acidobacteria bacterium AH-259-A15]